MTPKQNLTQQVRVFLREHGPLTFDDLMGLTGAPNPATLAWVLALLIHKDELYPSLVGYDLQESEEGCTQ